MSKFDTTFEKEVEMISSMMTSQDGSDGSDLEGYYDNNDILSSSAKDRPSTADEGEEIGGGGDSGVSNRDIIFKL